MPAPPRVAVLDYGAGNLRSAQRALLRAGAQAFIASDADQADRADGLVVPGVGHFGQCVRAFRAAGFDALVGAWQNDGRPVLGICVGMQILYERSEEAPGVPGLGVLSGLVRRLPAGLTVPHMGWNVVHAVGRDTGRAGGEGQDPLLDGVAGEQAYFVHSYYAQPADAEHVVATCPYGPGFPCIVRVGSVVGTQFHPEKSAEVGARLLRHWVSDVQRQHPLVGARTTAPGR